MSAVPRQRPAQVSVRRRRSHVGALIAAVAYAGAVFLAYQLIVPSFTHPASDEVASAAAPSATGTSAAEALTLRALAGKVKASTYAVEGAGGANGFGFLGWVHEQDRASFVVTARSVVAGVLADGGRQVYVKQGNRFWPARITRVDEDWGLAVLRVGVLLDRPLWQKTKEDRGSLKKDIRAIVVPGGNGGFGEGALVNDSGTFLLPAGAEQAYVGAPVVVDDGKVAGVVVGVGPNGESRLAPLAAACRKIRDC